MGVYALHNHRVILLNTNVAFISRNLPGVFQGLSVSLVFEQIGLGSW